MVLVSWERTYLLNLKNKFKIYISSRNIENGVKIAKKLNINFVPLDISNYDKVDEILFDIKPDIIIHSAASKFVDISEKFVSETIDSNIIGSKNLFICAKKINVKNLLQSHLIKRVHHLPICMRCLKLSWKEV